MRNTGFLALLAMALVGCGGAPPEGPNFETTEIADGVYQFRFVGHNGLFVVTPEGVVAFDPISEEAAARYADEIQRVAPGAPLAAIVYSHQHADHATGAGVLRERFGAGVPIIAHENAVAPIQARGDPAQPVPDSTVSDTLTLGGGDHAVELHYLGRSHSDDLLVALLPRQRVAFAVDLVANDRLGYRDLPDHFYPDFYDALDRLQDLAYDTIVFGHGRPGDRAAVDRQIQYYDDLRSAVSDAVAMSLDEDETAAQVTLDDYAAWGQYDQWRELNVRAMHRWLSERE